MGAMHSTPDLLIAEFTPAAADGRVSRGFRSMVSGIISLVISLVIAGVIVYLRHEQMTTPLPWVVLGIMVGISLVRFVYSLVRWRLAVRERREVGEGAALVVGRFGVELEGRRFDWPAVQGIDTRRKRFHASPLVRVSSADGAVEVPLEHLDVLPASLDSAVRIFSGGRQGVDLAAVDD